MMSTIKRFEDLPVWIQARTLCNEIYEIIQKGEFARDFVLRDQLKKSAISVMANIAEGFERSGNSEFAHFLAIAKGSCGETRSHLHLAHDRSYISAEDYERLHRLALDLGKGLSGFMKYLSQSEFKGFKFREDPAVYMEQS